MKQKLKRGDKGYFAFCRKRETKKTIILFVVPLFLFISGYLVTESRMNLLTVVAVLGMLPASRSLVTLVMYLKGHGISDEDYAILAEYTEGLTSAYDNVFTTYEKTYEVPSLVVRSGNVCGYVAKEYKTLQELEKHLTTCIKKEGYNVNVKIFDNIESYKARLISISKLQESEQETDFAIRKILFEISL